MIKLLSSVNHLHLHFQLFIREKSLPVAESQWPEMAVHMYILRPVMFLVVAKKVANSLKNYINPTLHIICFII